MSTVMPDAGSFVILSQVKPHGNPTDGPEEEECYKAPTNMPKQLVKFFQGEPEALGAIQVFVGTILITFGIILTVASGDRYLPVDIVIYSGVAFWASIMYIISGSLSIAASVKPTVGKVKSSLVLNILSSVMAGSAIILIAISFPSIRYNYYYYRNTGFTYCAYYQPSEDCEGDFNTKVFLTCVVSLFLLLTILEFTITISTSVFGCKTVCRTSYNEMTVVIYQTTSLNVPDATAASMAALSSDGAVHKI